MIIGEGAPEPIEPEDGTPPGFTGFLRRMPPVPFVLLSLVALFFSYQVIGGMFTFMILGGEIGQENIVASRWITAFGQLLLMLFPTLLLVHLRHGNIAGFFGARFPGVRETIASFVGVFSLQQVLQGYMFFQESIPLPDSLERLIEPVREMIDEIYRLLVMSYSFEEFLAVTLVVAVIPAVTEELLFRGLVQKNIGQVSGGAKAACWVGLVFAAFHLNPFTFIPLAILGSYFGLLTYRSGNISLSVAAHFLNNFLACIVAFTGLADDFVVVAPAGGPSTVETLLNTLLFLCLFGLSTFYFFRITTRPPGTTE